MAARRQPRRSPRFSLGGEQAEADSLLSNSFYETGQYATVSDRDDPKCFIIGRTGSGKSAMLQQIYQDNPNHVIRITPEDLSLPYICDSGAIKVLRENNVHLAPFFIALWKHVFLVEIIRHRYSVKSAGAKNNFLTTLRARISQDPSKLAALDYLNEFQDRFWCETDERVREITDKFESQVKAQAGVDSQLVGAKLGAAVGSVASSEIRTELVERYQRIVNGTQLPRLNKMTAVLDEDILDTPNHYTWIVIDDLDRDWVDDSLVHDLILCLFRAVVDLKRVRNLKILVALRTNILHELNFSENAGAQEEKFRALSMHLHWSKPDIEAMLDERIRAAAERTGQRDLQSARDLLPNKNTRRGDPLDFVLRRTMMRPRDAIAFLNACCEKSGGAAKISWENLISAEQPYSSDRLLALRDEWKPSYPGLDAVFAVFRGASAVMTPDKFLVYLEDISLLLATSEFSSRDWLMDLLKPVWEGTSSGEHRLESFQSLITLLYDIGFIGVRLAAPKAIFAQDQPDLLRQYKALHSIAGYVVHPTFWAGLGIGERSDV